MRPGAPLVEAQIRGDPAAALVVWLVAQGLVAGLPRTGPEHEDVRTPLERRLLSMRPMGQPRGPARSRAALASIR